MRQAPTTPGACCSPCWANWSCPPGARPGRQYDEFITAFSGAVGPEPLARVIDLVHAWRRFPWIDPGLPAMFLPAPWSGAAAAELFGRLHARWADEAIAEWKQLLARP